MEVNVKCFTELIHFSGIHYHFAFYLLVLIILLPRFTHVNKRGRIIIKILNLFIILLWTHLYHPSFNQPYKRVFTLRIKQLLNIYQSVHITYFNRTLSIYFVADWVYWDWACLTYCGCCCCCYWTLANFFQMTKTYYFVGKELCCCCWTLAIFLSAKFFSNVIFRFFEQSSSLEGLTDLKECNFGNIIH